MINIYCLYSSVEERTPSKRDVLSSILSEGLPL